ncbi:MAG: RluA family pseudouridine synthase [Deltaproteobacteria bacterium]|nr:RluA family pseudouridine synthase [Deltaproteobacteria bacterium]
MKNPQIIYEDKYLVVISKPEGLYSTSTGNPKNPFIGGLFPGFFLTHRLDADTSGLLILAKSKQVAEKITQQFKNREVHKTYMGVSKKKIENPFQDTWKDKLQKTKKGRMKVVEGDGLTAITEVEGLPIKLGTLLIFKPLTGRTHQLRIQSKHHGFPLLGDKLYGKEPYKRLMLHAFKISFKHPYQSRVLTLKDKLPEEFNRFLNCG